MARNTYRDDPDFLFELHFDLYTTPSRVTIRAWDLHREEPPTYHRYIKVMMLYNGETIFPNLEIGIPSGTSIDGEKAKEHAVFWCSVASDDDESVTPEQREWVHEHGGALSLLAGDRWGQPWGCDRSGGEDPMKKSEIMMSEAIRTILSGVSAYCAAFERELECKVGNDVVIGDEGVLLILRGLRTLLNGPTGKIDCGSFDAAILELARKAGFKEEEIG